MRTLHCVVEVISWILLAVALYAFWPALIKLLILANHLHQLFACWNPVAGF